MFWTKEKIEKRLHELYSYRYRHRIPIDHWYCQEDDEGTVGMHPPQNIDAWKDMSIGERWSGKDRYLWLQQTVYIPAEWEDEIIMLYVDFGQTGGGNNSGFEGLLFVNGTLYQGVDSNHREIMLNSDCAGENVELSVRLWSGLTGYNPQASVEHQLTSAFIAIIEESTDDLYFSAKAMLDTVKNIDEHRVEWHQMVPVLDQAFLEIDWSRPGTDDFYNSVAIAGDVLQQKLTSLPKHHPVTVQCIGHTHIDLAWLWRVKHTREKSARSFATVLRLMEQYPEYIFLQTQPQLYAFLKEDYPDLYAQIQEKVRKGKWEVGGAMWVEADSNLPNGESLVRQLLYGIRFFEQEFGVTCRYLWLPDVFGYSWALPQILKKSGIEVFMTTKISWNQYNRMPHDTFRWRGVDGTEIVTHFITTPDPGSDKDSFFYTYNGAVTPESVNGIWESYRDKSLNQELLLAYGYGDGGGGVTREMLEMRRRLDKLPGVPNVTTGRVDDYFSRLRQKVNETMEYVHTWDGELYLELHRGTYTSQAVVKRANRKLELMYRRTEWLSAMQSIHQHDWRTYPQQQLEKGWKLLLRNQFHDIIPGSSIAEVYTDAQRDYDHAASIADDAWQTATSALVSGTQSDETYATVFNSASWKRSGIVRIPITTENENGHWQAVDGVQLVSQRSATDWYVFVPDVPALGYKTIHYVPDSHSLAHPFTLWERAIETPFYKMTWNECGQVQRIYDKDAQRDVLASNALGNVLQVFEDKPKGRHEAWDIDIFYTEKQRIVNKLLEWEVEEVGPARAVIRMKWSYMDSIITQHVITYAHSRRIDFQTEVDWHEPRQLLKVAFPVDIRATEATYDIQFGNVTRPTHWNTSWDWARFETVGHQWADISERGYGVSLLNDCKYGYDIKDNVMRLSLIKTAKVPAPAADQGIHTFTYSLLPHQGDWFDGHTVQEAWDLNCPLIHSVGKAAHPERSLFRISSNHVFIDTVKKAEDEDQMVMRLHEFGGARGTVRIESDYRVTSWQSCDLLERSNGASLHTNTIQFQIEPYEIRTFLVDIG